MQLILILDDDAPTLEALGEILEYEGYACLQASTGAEALRALQERQPALVVAGDEFLDMDAIAFLIAKAANAAVAATPVIVTTADWRLRPISGAVAVLLKPYGIAELLRLIQVHLPPDHAPVAA